MRKNELCPTLRPAKRPGPCPLDDEVAVCTDDAVGPTPISVLVVDDHEVVALGIKALLEQAGEVQVLGIAASVESAVDAATDLAPDVVLLDFRLQDGTGDDAARRLRRLDPAPGIVMISALADRRVLGLALEAGCHGFVSKNADQQDLVKAVRAAAAGDSYFTPDMLKHLMHLRRFEQVATSELSPREVEVLQLTANGSSPDGIAKQIHLSPHTVRNHLRNAMAKLDAHTKLEAVVKAARARAISIDL